MDAPSRRTACIGVIAVLLGYAACVHTRLLPRPAPHVTFVAQWPAQGQAAVFVAGWSAAAASPDQTPVPIASLAKIMTAAIVLSRHPLRAGEAGPLLRVTADDVADLTDRQQQDQSVVAVSTGEQLTELQALQALLIASANNVAAILARWVDGSPTAFVARMNATARSLRLRHSKYTDPSGFDAGTVSTASDQLVVMQHAMRDPVFAAIAGTASVALPVAGVIHNTDTLLGRDGVVAGKTGSDDAAGGCFAFTARRQVDGRPVTVTGVVLGQVGGAGFVPQALSAAVTLIQRALADPAR